MKPLPPKFFLGVEGGATKSAAILVDANDKVLGKRKGKALNWRNEGETGVKRNLHALISPFLEKAKNGKIYAVFGFAGLDTKKEEAIYARIVKSVLPRDSLFRVVNDGDIAMEAKCPNEKSRVLVISGTGSTVRGENKGKKAMSVGWDFILGDEGSGYAVGLMVLKAAVRAWDGRGEATALRDFVLKKTSFKSMEEFIPGFYRVSRNNKQSVKSYIASFATVVDAAILQRDGAALRIRDETVKELMGGIRAVASRLEIENRKFCIGLAGSVWKMPGLKELFTKEASKQFPRAIFSKRENSPVLGAIALAKQLHSRNIKHETYSNQKF